ncbi:transporter substrate-binding domain-containing protein [Epibacterium ulvae]|uniref:transporter substrate-binding domain-containing protein n=1 Tax=Epibacterium ulvae TaxID=1156985 RepID=UPI002492E4AE|nr:transporter substrate-binding domain-containing protein [Epibacterium ulvae]
MSNARSVSGITLVAVLCGGPIVVQAETLTILAGNLPPMVDAHGKGREAEVITTVLERCGHSVTFKIEPFTRHWKSYAAGEGDGVATVPMGMELPGGQSGAYIQYQNGVSSLSARNDNFAALENLQGHSVIAFMGASQIIPGLADATSEFSKYQEIADQIGQSRMIFAGRVDAVIGDGMIFAEYNAQLQANSEDLRFDPHQDVSFQAIFAPSDYAMNFRSDAITADFNRCYGDAMADGTLDAINKKWVEKYRDTLGAQYLNY